MQKYSLDCEFDVTRRIGWSTDDLGTHIDEVVEYLRQSSDVSGIDVTADLDNGRTTAIIAFESWEMHLYEHATGTVAVAIRAAGGKHDGLLPFGEEAHLKQDSKGWSALKSPTWLLRRADLKRHAES
jgi:hypothetical protein